MQRGHIHNDVILSELSDTLLHLRVLQLWRVQILSSVDDALRSEAFLPQLMVIPRQEGLINESVQVASTDPMDDLARFFELLGNSSGNLEEGRDVDDLRSIQIARLR
jgi:hypothetical protein